MIICSHRDIKRAAEFYARELNLPEDTAVFIDTYSITIDTPYDGAAYMPNSNGIYRVEINMIDGQDPFLILAHEMVHVKQFSEGSLSYFENEATWKGETYIIPETVNYQEDFFFSAPWEREAIEFSEELYINWKLQK